MNQESPHTPESREDGKLNAEFHYEQSPVLKWLDNFWYHYKWRTIIIAFFVLVAVVVIVQIINRPKYDVNLVCAGVYRMDANEHPAFEAAVEKFIPEDYDGDGERSANIIVYEIYSDEDYREAASEAEANSEEFALNAQYNASEQQNFSQYSMMGECYVFLVSEYLYGQLLQNERLCSVASLYENEPLPTGVTEDGYGIRIGETDFYRFTPDIQAMPDDMILCLLRKAEFKNSTSDIERYERYQAFFKSIADYRVEE